VNLLESPLESQKNQYMYVMTNKWKNFGASAVFDPEALQKAAEAIGGTDFFILPSSVHELMIVPDNGEMDYRELCGMVREVNQNEVDPKDFLSDRVQYYDRGTKRVLGQEEYLEKFQGKQKTEEQQRSFGHGLPQRDRRIISPGF
jgi:hypothetical protein